MRRLSAEPVALAIYPMLSPFSADPNLVLSGEGIMQWTMLVQAMTLMPLLVTPGTEDGTGPVVAMPTFWPLLPTRLRADRSSKQANERVRV